MKYNCPKCKIKCNTNNINIQQESYLTYICPKCKTYFYFSPFKMFETALLYALTLIIFWSVYFFYTKTFSLHVNLKLVIFLLCVISFIILKILSFKNNCLIYSNKNVKAISVFKSGVSIGFFVYIALECTLVMYYMVTCIDNYTLLRMLLIIFIPCLPLLLIGILSSFLYKIMWQINRKMSKIEE